MPYLAYDFDALELAGPIGTHCGIPIEKVVYGNLLMWKHVWRTKSDIVTTGHIVAFFGVNACEALVIFGHLEATPDGFRVRGAAKWLKVQAAQSEAGKAHSGNLQRGRQDLKISPAGLRLPSGSTSGSSPALAASSQQPTATTTKETLAGKKPPANEIHPIQAAWNKGRPATVPEWTSTNGKRKTHADARLSDHPEPAFWDDVMAKISASDFLSGRKTDFRATPDWVINPSNLTKILEGNYAAGPAAPIKASDVREPPPRSAEESKRYMAELREKQGWDR